jgi:hypothetical protein
MRQLLDHAAEFGYGLPAFNVNNLEQMRAIMEAADKTDSPVIVQASAGARKYAGAPFLRHLILAAIEKLVAENARDDFTAAGSPTVGAVSEAVGFKVQAKEIATVWQQYHDKVAADKAAE